MPEHTGELVSVKIIPSEKGSPPGKLADAEVIFEADAGPLSGLQVDRLLCLGTSRWGRNVTFPARQFSVNGAQIQDAVKRLAPASEPLVSTADVIVTSNNAETMTASQWAVVNETRAILPDATVVLRSHTVSWKRDRTITVGPCFGILVTQRCGPFTLRREFRCEPTQTSKSKNRRSGND
jgi:hypothetical protein